MTRSFWIFEAFLAVAGVLAGLIFHCIFKFYVNPQMQDINWTWMGFITVTMLSGFPRLACCEENLVAAAYGFNQCL